MKPIVTAFFDEPTNTVSYVVTLPDSESCVIIDPVLGFDLSSGRLNYAHADLMLTFIDDLDLRVEWILETHVHADHFSAASYLAEKLHAPIGIGARITQVQAVFKDFFNLSSDFAIDGSQFSHLFQDGEHFSVGGSTVEVIHTPGHTPACVTYVIGDAAFIGDTLFMPDYGTARTDFPGGDASGLYHSIQTLLSLPKSTRLFTGHDYKTEKRDEYRWESTVEQQLAENKHVGAGIGEAEFVAMRNERDKTLAVPKLLLPALQVNIRGGSLPPPEGNGVSYLKIPLDAL